MADLLELSEVIKSISGASSLEDLLKAMAQAARALTGVEWAGTTTEVGDAGDGTRFAPSWQLRMNEGPGGWVAQHQKPLVITGYEGASCLPPHLLRTEGISSCIVVPLMVGKEPKGILYVINSHPHRFAEEEMMSLSILAEHGAIAMGKLQLLQEAQRQAITDGLTGIYNYRYFQESLGREIALAQRHQHSLSLLLIDIDGLKGVNDTYGHQAGDKVLEELAAMLKSSLRQTDIVARYGGDEFVIIAPHTTPEGASVLIGRLGGVVEAHLFDVGQARIRVSVSFGAASLSDRAKDMESLIGEADRALYLAKEAKPLGQGEEAW